MNKVLTGEPDLCTGCRACEVACALRVAPASRPAAARLSILRLPEAGRHLPQVCRQCAVPLCAAACPVDALVRDGATGAVVLREDRCIGCRLCIEACPFGMMGIEPDTGEIVKCDLCGGDPACVAHCPTGAVGFEDPGRAARNRRRALGAKALEDLGGVDGPGGGERS